MSPLPFLSFGDLWSRRWGSLFGVGLVWDWTLLVALLVSVFMAGPMIGWAWCWVGPLTWISLVMLRLVCRLAVIGRVTYRPDTTRLWFLGDDTPVRLPRRAWPRILVGGVGPAVTGLVAVLAGLVDLSEPIAGFVGMIALWFTILHLIPLPPCDGQWFWRGVLLPFLGLRRAAIGATGLGIAGCGVAALLCVVFGHLLGALCFIMSTVLAVRLYQVVRTGFDPVEDAPLDGGRDDGLLARWRVARQEARDARDARQRADEDALLDRLLAKVSTEGLPSLTESERRQLHAISERRRQESP